MEPYNSAYPDMFQTKSQAIQKALGTNCITVHHIGSTSVPYLAAKPIIDILPVVKDIRIVDQHTLSMNNLGYEAKGEHGIPFRRFFKKEGFNVHAFEVASPEISKHLLFAQFLMKHPEICTQYEQLKFNLAKQFPNDITSYCLGKDTFIREIFKNAFNKLIKASFY
ncbi:GrpB family protein [Rickettsiales endosymbiont of Stachyamoeba lipophora]|uniref:GrpB family protein n=1 Tax=Rickettsiales endosymbiont of Stachyamoeba lipophora TaxID=2486578 RepID=UPI0024086299|nr:GrpB family protein [Rickettsiales endosymbiont of Stachyamoeba lipophora]